MSEACEDFRGRAAENLASELSSVTVDPETDALLSQIHGFVHSADYAEAVELISRLQDSLAEKRSAVLV
ncbi:MAG: hypothetical protein LBS84_01985 [Clostridiales bacterium]|nr:hypothetical protein [Clostridiales bacterium]